MAYFDDKEKIECPYCKAINPETDWYPDQDQNTTVECSSCEKEYTITASYSISITTTCGPEDSKYTEACEYRVMEIGGKKPEPKLIGGKMQIYAECIYCEETAFVDPDKITII
jgi:hypothetical protein